MSQTGKGRSQPAREPKVSGRAGDPGKLDLAFKLRDYHHNAIWEEQKHFTWLISIILSAQLIALTGARLDRPSKVTLILIASVVGVLLSITAFRVQRKEGEYFRNANARFIEEYNAFYPEAPMILPGPLANKRITHLITSVFSGRLGVRDYFQILFLAFAVVFSSMAIFACVAL